MLSESNYELNPSQMLSLANRVVYDSAHGKIMMTFFVAVLDFDAHALQFASAAHNPPWLFSKNADGTYKMSSLVAKGQRLGEARDGESYESKTIEFKQGDTLFLYTDGLLEGKNLAQEQYGKKQARKILESVMNKEPTQVLNELVLDFMSFNEGKALDDDVTLVLARILK
jgi:serine phosphatase RsbU (regulator of sigma subunit)